MFMDHTTIFPFYWTGAKIFCIPSSSSRPPNQLAFSISSLSDSLITRPDRSRAEDSTPGLKKNFFLVEVLCDITCVLEFVGDGISVADVKHVIWKFQNTGVIFIFCYVYCFRAWGQILEMSRFSSTCVAR